MEKARFNPRYAGVHIWLRKDKDLKTSFKRRVSDEIYELFSYYYENNVKTWYGEHNIMWLDWFGGSGQATGSFGPNTQPPEYVANQIPSNPGATYGGGWWGQNTNNSAWMYGKTAWYGGKSWYGFDWTWWQGIAHPGGVSLNCTPHNQYDAALRYFKDTQHDRGGLGPGAYAVWYVNGRPSMDLYDLLYPQFSDNTKNGIMTEIPDTWKGHK